MKPLKAIPSLIKWIPAMVVLFMTALVLSAHLPGKSDEKLDPDVAAAVIDDPKIVRTAKIHQHEMTKIKHDAKLTSIDRQGVVFRFSMPDAMAELFHKSRGRTVFSNPAKARWREALLRINDLPEFKVLMRVRGAMSTKIRKKSYHVNLMTSQALTPRIAARKVFLLNMYTDIYGFKMAFSYDVLNRLGLFPAYHQFAVVYINGEPQGLYLLLERPEDAIKRSVKNVVAVQRQRFYYLETKYAAPDTDPLAVHKQLRNIHDIKDEKKQVVEYEKHIDLDLYMKWLAFNSLVQNGDTFDEIFWYEVRKEKETVGRLRLMAWDYDEIPCEQPEESEKNPFMWGARNAIDRQIATNRILLNRYRRIMYNQLTQFLTTSYLTKKIDSIQRILDGIETGLPPEEERTLRMGREKAVQAFIGEMLKRREALLGELGAD